MKCTGGAPLLSVCIPTYNRVALVGILVTKLIVLLRQTIGSGYEIVVSDNHSPDRTRPTLEEKFGGAEVVRLVSPDQHYPTAEENLCFAVSCCRGEYVWILGDDDAVEKDTLLTLRDMLKQGQHDLLIFNSRAVSYHGDRLRKTRIPCLKPLVPMEMLDFVRATGFWFVLAGFSTTVFRRSKADIDQFRDILGIGKIYAHVTWLISQFYDSSFAFVNRPLVSYRQNLTDVVPTEHWERVAEREGLYVGGIWSVGFLKQMDYLVARGVIEREFLRDVVDRNLDHRFYFPDEVLGHMLNSLARGPSGGVRTVTGSELAYFCSWLYELFGDNLYLISLFEEMVRAVEAGATPPAEPLARASGLLGARRSMRWYEHFHVYDVYGYSVYRHGPRWFGILMGEFDAVDFLLQSLDFGDFERVLFVRASEGELLECLAAQPMRRFAVETVRRHQPHRVVETTRLLSKVVFVFRNEGVMGVARRVFWRLARA